MKVKMLILLFFMSLLSYGQNKVYNTKVEKANNVIINNKNFIDTQIVYNPFPRKAKLYVLNCEIFETKIFFTDTLNNNAEVVSSIKKMVFTIGNPDNEVVYDTDWDLEFPLGYDTAYFERSKYVQFDKNKVRDSYTVLSKDKKHISYKAGYVGANHFLRLIVVIPYFSNGVFVYHRIGKLD